MNYHARLIVMPGPTIRRIQLGKELQRLRESAGVTRPEAAAAIGRSPGYIGHIEIGRNPPGKSDLIVLLRDHYGVDAVTLATLEDLRAEASTRGWWSTYGLPEWLAGYVGLETDATSLRCLELENLPGLLQTEQYMRRLYALDVRLSAREVDKRVPARMRRQDRLVGDNPLELCAIISQAALERCAREKSVAADQLAHLINRAKLPNVELRVLPFDLGLHVGQAGPFCLLSFPDGLLDDVAYQEYSVGGHLIDDESVVSQLDTLFGELHSKSLGPNESLAMIVQLAETHGK
jgi:transcriptional regulator with XRE-family HTH domain